MNASRNVESDPDYLRGACHVFATALHRACGFGYLLLVDEADLYPNGACAVHHVYAVDADGFAFDVRGKHSLDDVISQWMAMSEGEASTMTPASIRFESEADLMPYVSDDWSCPLTAYSDLDVASALETALDTLGPLLISNDARQP